jgi:type I restriction enzyme S subunit
MTGTNPNIQKINQKKIMHFSFPAKVHMSEQRRIVVQLDLIQAEIYRLKRLQAAASVELQALLPSVLDRAFKGEL